MNKLIITGTITGYWEQGWEGRIDYVFEPDDPQYRPEGTWPIMIQNGQELHIFDERGETLWHGRVQLVRKRWYERTDPAIKVWHTEKQKGISYRQWLNWFWHKPPLRAELTRQE